jgi:hypothetical protein
MNHELSRDKVYFRFERQVMTRVRTVHVELAQLDPYLIRLEAFEEVVPDELR